MIDQHQLTEIRGLLNQLSGMSLEKLKREYSINSTMMYNSEMDDYGYYKARRDLAANCAYLLFEVDLSADTKVSQAA